MWFVVDLINANNTILVNFLPEFMEYVAHSLTRGLDLLGIVYMIITFQGSGSHTCVGKMTLASVSLACMICK